MAQKKPRCSRPSRRRWSRPRSVTFLSWTRCSTGFPEGGRSCSRGATSGGCGWHSAEEHARLWPMLSETGARLPAACFGSVFPNGTRCACCSPTSGRRTRTFCHQSSIVRRAKAPGRRATLNGSTTFCGSGWGVLCGARCRFLRRTPCTRIARSYSFTTTTHASKTGSNATREPLPNIYISI